MNPAYVDFFQRATGHRPYPFQERFASGKLPWLVNVPTGLGKTAMVIVGWLWRRLRADAATRSATPRRLVYCLPMRVLVEQTQEATLAWLQALGLLAGRAGSGPENGRSRGQSYVPNPRESGRVDVYRIMGGEEEEEWEIHPEREAIIIGTQDMLLSRALNRGYGVSRSRWPMQFGALHTDCLWVFDEIQLMGAGLASSAQLEAFRRILPKEDAEPAIAAHGSRSLWMSATLRPEWLRTVDFARVMPERLDLLELDAGDLEDERVRRRWNARKPVKKSSAKVGNAQALAKHVLDEHRKKYKKEHKSGTRTIIVLNTVRRARELFGALRSELGANGSPRLVLLHSRFRAADREKALKRVLEEPPPAGTIVVSTQVIEAGVDVSAATLFTEIAPWASLVQRFGRCNREGKEDEGACLWYVPLPEGKHSEELCRPYGREDLEDAARQLAKLEDAGLKSLPKEVKLRFEHAHVLRRKDLVDLFDTTPDLSGGDIDIDRFVRDVDESDVRVFWRDCGEDPNAARGDQGQGGEPSPEPGPRREELCPAPIGEFRDFLKKHRGKVWRWSFLERRWGSAEPAMISPGQVFLIESRAGGYKPETGWSPRSRAPVSPLALAGGAERWPDATDADDLSRAGVWQRIAEHTDSVCGELDRILADLDLDGVEVEALRIAARWHDRGKAHPAFLAKLREEALRAPEAQACLQQGHAPAKAPGTAWVSRRNENKGHRRYFRHELASALAVLAAQESEIRGEIRDLVAYLVAAHHGKVRLSIRSLPNEMPPGGDPLPPSAGNRFARGVWDGDRLPVTHLGGGVVAPAIAISLEPMELGLCDHKPFSGQPSWAERMIRLRDRIGPFRLAYLELLLRAADIRASAAAGKEVCLARS